MPPTQTLVFAKKFRLPSPAAHIIQTLNMAWGFRSAGARVKLFPGINRPVLAPLLPSIEKGYQLDTYFRPEITFLSGRNKGMYGLLFRTALLKEWIANPDALFFARDVSETLFLLTLRKLFQRRQKIVYEMHDSLYLEHRAQGKKDAPTCKKHEQKILSNIDGIIYTGTYLKKKIEALYAPSIPSLVAVPGFNKHIFHPLPPEKNTTTVRIGYFGSLHPAKGVSLLLDALKILPDNYHLRIIGGNPENELGALKHRVRREFDHPDRVEFAGQVAPCNVRQHLKGCHMITIPFISNVEFLSPIKLYEALGMGLPVVATPVPAVQSAAAELPHVVLSSSARPEDLAETLRCLGDNARQRNSMHTQALALHSMHDWEHRARRICAFSCDLPHRRKRSARSGAARPQPTPLGTSLRSSR